MRFSSSRLARLIAMLMALSLFAAACGDDEEDDPVAADDTETEEESSESEASEGSSESEPAGGSGELSGDVNVSGSSTVQPISVRVAELFEEVEPDVVVNVDGPGTGDGFELFCNGETDEACALREIEEESGLRCSLGAELPSTRYTDHKDRPKVVRYWLATVVDGEFAPNDEVDAIRWVDPAEAMRLISYERDREVLAAATSA